MRADDIPPEFSLVVPFFNEEAVAFDVVSEIGRALSRLGMPWEAILVDDGSSDETVRELQRGCAPWPCCRILRLPENRGQGAALWEGIQAARGPVIAMMDGDGQNLPEDFALLLPLLANADLVVGIRVERDDSAVRKACSRIANAVRGRLLQDRVRDAGCAVKLFRREVAASFWPVPMLNPFIPAFAAAAGFRTAEHPVRHRARKGGKSKYGLEVILWKPALDMLSLWWLLRRKRGKRKSAP